MRWWELEQGWGGGSEGAFMVASPCCLSGGLEKCSTQLQRQRHQHNHKHFLCKLQWANIWITHLMTTMTSNIMAAVNGFLLGSITLAAPWQLDWEPRPKTSHSTGVKLTCICLELTLLPLKPHKQQVQTVNKLRKPPSGQHSSLAATIHALYHQIRTKDMLEKCIRTYRRQKLSLRKRCSHPSLV